MPLYVIDFLKANEPKSKEAPRELEQEPLLPAQLELDLRPVEIQKAA